MTSPEPISQDRAAQVGWRATYRLQLNPGFSFQDARAVLPYLRTLGISHVYLSPCLTATPGSEHGYDVSDPTSIDEELGGEEEFRGLSEAAAENGLGLLLDIVPNHMTTHGSNSYFQDVLAHGRLSPHASKFDLYDLVKTGEPIAIGTLGGPYGDVLSRQEIGVRLEGKNLVVHYYEHTFPTSPASWDKLLGLRDHPLCEVCESLRELSEFPSARLEQARSEYAHLLDRAKAILSELFSTTKEEFEKRLASLSEDPEELDSVLRLQNFRLMWWKLEGEYVNYRRFFNIGSLIGIRMEDPEVFEWSHALIRKLVQSGHIHGLRVDHPDGLRDPTSYFEELRGVLKHGPIYVEKILDEEEKLPEAWPVSGTVGYDFLSRVNRLFMDESRSEAMTSIYAEFTGHPTNYLALVRDQKRAVLERHFRGDLLRLTTIGMQVAEESYMTRDVSQLDLEHAITQTIVALPIYRTYLTGRERSPAQVQILRDAVSLARSRVLPFTESRARAFDFVQNALLSAPTTGAQKEFVARFQQLAPAVMAKGAEDTTFYRYDRLVSCNEVGSQPSALGISAEHFHQYLSHLHQCWPENLLATSTHDTKRSEDVRARISVLSEIPELWHTQVLAWAEQNAPAWRGRQPDRHAEYLLYQTLVGAHPLSEERAFQYVQKAAREAKIFTSWHEPNAVYEQKLQEFIAGVFDDVEFQQSLRRFCEPLIRPGRINSLSQTLVKLTAPGVPDFYQGTELWDLSLVDPDNRRPVDFGARTKMLERAQRLSVDQLADEWDSGLVKLWMIDRVLTIRRENSDIFGLDYRPLIARGEKLRHVLAYARGEDMVVVVPRFSMSIDEDFGETELDLPPGKYKCSFSGKEFDGVAAVGELFEKFPVALLLNNRLIVAPSES